MILAAEPIIPAWLAYLGWASTAILALGVLWRKVVKPSFRVASSAEEMLPLLKELTTTFRDNPMSFQVLAEIAAQFRTDGGSSLRDVINRLEAASVENKSAAQILAVGVEAARQLAERDREQLTDIMARTERNAVRLDDALKALSSIEKRASSVADNLAVAQTAVDGVAADLAATHERANAVTGEPGAAADAAMKPPT